MAEELFLLINMARESFRLHVRLADGCWGRGRCGPKIWAV